MHIDAAYAGSSFICPEFRPLLDGVEVNRVFFFFLLNTFMEEVCLKFSFVSRFSPIGKSSGFSIVLLTYKD